MKRRLEEVPMFMGQVLDLYYGTLCTRLIFLIDMNISVEKTFEKSTHFHSGRQYGGLKLPSANGVSAGGMIVIQNPFAPISCSPRAVFRLI